MRLKAFSCESMTPEHVEQDCNDWLDAVMADPSVANFRILRTELEFDADGDGMLLVFWTCEDPGSCA